MRPFCRKSIRMLFHKITKSISWKTIDLNHYFLNPKIQINPIESKLRCFKLKRRIFPSIGRENSINRQPPFDHPFQHYCQNFPNAIHLANSSIIYTTRLIKSVTRSLSQCQISAKLVIRMVACLSSILPVPNNSPSSL